MKDISLMSRAELVRELIASPSTTAAETAAPYVETRSSRRSGTRDALVSHKLAVARELLLRDLAERMKAEPVLSAPAAVRDWLRLYCANLQHEVFIILLLDAQNRLIEAQELFRGTLSQTSVYPREVVKATLARNAAAVMFAHFVPRHKMRVLCSGSFCDGVGLVR
jgi:DNA repair protein RadC